MASENVFLNAVASVLEVDRISLDDEFRNVPGWCSLQGFGLIVLLQNDWATPITFGDFRALKTVRDLYREVFRTFAAGVLGVNRAELSGSTRYGSIPAWDSVAHLRLVMEAEKRFGTHYPLERIPFLSTLDDFLVLTEKGGI